MSPSGNWKHVSIPGDPYVTNICFGGPGLKTAYITLSMSGRLIAMDWETGGCPLNYLNV